MIKKSRRKQKKKNSKKKQKKHKNRRTQKNSGQPPLLAERHPCFISDFVCGQPADSRSDVRQNSRSDVCPDVRLFDLLGKSGVGPQLVDDDDRHHDYGGDEHERKRQVARRRLKDAEARSDDR